MRQVIETVLRSEDLPIADRFEWWRDVISRSLTPAEVTSEHAADFRTTARQLQLGAARVSVLSYPPMFVSRTPAVRQSDPQLYHLALGLRGRRGMSQCGRDALLEEGGLLLYDTSHSYEAQSFDAVEAIRISMPRTALHRSGRKSTASW